MKTIGLIGGTTWLSTMEYYRLLNEYVSRRVGGGHTAKLLMYSVDFAHVSQLQRQGKWDVITSEYTALATALQAAGAECLMLCANTMHKIAGELQSAIGIPIIHVGEATALEVKRANLRTAGLLGTKYTMEMDFYRKKLDDHGIATIIPPENERSAIHAAIHNEFSKGIFRHATKEQFKTIIAGLVERGAEGIILGCTEIPILIKQADSPVPVFDTTDIHVRAAVAFATD